MSFPTLEIKPVLLPAFQSTNQQRRDGYENFMFTQITLVLLLFPLQHAAQSREKVNRDKENGNQEI